MGPAISVPQPQPISPYNWLLHQIDSELTIIHCWMASQKMHCISNIKIAELKGPYSR